MRKIKQKHDIGHTLFLGLITRYFDSKKNKWCVRINKSRLALLLIGLLCVGWILSATTVYCGLRYLRKYDALSFVQVLKNPFSTTKFRVQMGEAQIARAHECLKKKDIQGAYLNLIYGTARNPDNLDARILLAQMYMSLLKDSKKASETLDYRIIKAFQEKNESYLLTSIYAFSLATDYKFKSVKLLARCSENNVVQEEKLHAILKSVITTMYKEKKYNDLIEYCRELLKSTTDKELVSIASKNCALTLSNISRSAEALKVLKENNINAGEVFVLVKIANAIEQEDEITASKMLKISISKIKHKEPAYDMLARLAKDFGDENGAKQAEKMKKILSGEIEDTTLESIKNNSIKNPIKVIENYLSQNPRNADKLLKAVLFSKNLDTINACLKMKMSAQSHFSLTLAKIEILLKRKDVREASTLLESLKYSDYVKSNKLENALEGFNLTALALSNNNIFEALDNFVKTHSTLEVIALSKMFFKVGLKQESAYLINKTLEKYPKDIRVSDAFTRMAFENNDIQAIFDAYKRYSIRIPICILAKLSDNFSSDKCIFYSPETLGELKKKSDKAKEKIVAYKKIFGNF